ARAEETVTLRLERAVVDGLGLLDLAERPGADLLRARDRDLDLIEHRRRRLVAERVVDQVLVHCIHRFDLPSRRVRRRPVGSVSNVVPDAANAAIRDPFQVYSAAFSLRPSTSSTLRPSERISFTSTLN